MGLYANAQTGGAAAGPPGGIVRVAFSAGLTSVINITDHVNVTYDRVWVNTGGAYDNTTGRFKAPYDGTYLFMYHALAENDGQLWLDLYVNNDYKSSCYAHVTNDWASASNVMALSLKKDDIVYVNTHGDSVLYGDPNEVYTTFSGYLMYSGVKPSTK